MDRPEDELREEYALGSEDLEPEVALRPVEKLRSGLVREESVLRESVRREEDRESVLPEDELLLVRRGVLRSDEEDRVLSASKVLIRRAAEADGSEDESEDRDDRPVKARRVASPVAPPVRPVRPYSLTALRSALDRSRLMARPSAARNPDACLSLIVPCPFLDRRVTPRTAPCRSNDLATFRPRDRAKVLAASP